MKSTTNYGLNKPESTDFYNVNDFNTNMDKIDAELKKHANHISNKSNPHSVTKSQVGLGNADNTSDKDKPISTATQKALDLKANATDLTSHTSSKSNPHNVTKAQIGLGNAENTSDLDKPISKAVQAELDKIKQSIIDVDAINEATGSGIILTDTADGALSDIAVYGRSEQKQYSGKNLLTYPYYETTKTKDGITWTDNGDGTITANGTNTKNGQNLFSCRTRTETNNGLILPAGTYLLTGCPSGGSTSTYYIQVGRTVDGGYSSLGVDGGNGVVFTLTEDTQLQIQPVVASLASVSNIVFKPMVRLATIEDNTYEPYVGCMQSPNPDYPQDIVSVGGSGTLEVKSTGKNLIPYPYYNGDNTLNNITFTTTNGTITFNGVPTKGFAYRIISVNDNFFIPAGTYTISGMNNEYSEWSAIRVYDWTSGGSNYDKILATDYGNGATFTVDNATRIEIRLNINTTDTGFNNATVTPQLEHGNVATDTEPYKSSTVSIPLTEPLRSIGKVKDEIACIDGVYGVIRRIGKKIIDGINITTSWTGTVKPASIATQINLGNAEDWKDSTTNNSFNLFMCDKFTPFEYTGDNNVMMYGTRAVKASGIICCYVPVELGITNVSQANEWLKSNNVTVQYILAEEVFEPFENQELFKNIVTYDNVTYITATDSADMWVEYYSNSNVGQRLAHTNEEMRAEHKALQEQITSLAEKPPMLVKQRTQYVGLLGQMASISLYEAVDYIEGYKPLMYFYVRNSANMQYVIPYTMCDIITDYAAMVTLTNHHTTKSYDEVEVTYNVLYVRE